MALLLSAQTGQPVTAAMLLGEEAEEIADRTAEAEASVEKLLKKMDEAGLRKPSKERP